MSVMRQEGEKRPRGRPRPQETVDRDREVLKLLKRREMTRNEISEALGVAHTITYLSLSRLRANKDAEGNPAPLVRKLCGTGSSTLWTANVEDRCQ